MYVYMAELISISRKCRVTRAGPELAESIYVLIAECGRELAASGFDNWTPPPVSVETLRESAARDVVLVASSAATGRTRDELFGTITLADRPAHPFDVQCREGDVKWNAPPDALAWYMSRLAVRPGWQQRGIGLELLTVAEGYARKHGVAALRLDALAANERLTRWYRRIGYVRCGHRTHSGWEFDVLERLL